MKRDEDYNFEPSEDHPMVVSDKNIALPLWAVISLVIAFVSGTIAFMATLYSIKTDIRAVAIDQWRLSDQREWAHLMERNNPALKLPDPDEIKNRLRSNYYNP